MNILELISIVEDMQKGKRLFDKEVLIEIIEVLWGEDFFDSDDQTAMELALEEDDKSKFYSLFWDLM